jgi:hypothetical protein
LIHLARQSHLLYCRVTMTKSHCIVTQQVLQYCPDHDDCHLKSGISEPCPGEK